MIENIILIYARDEIKFLYIQFTYYLLINMMILINWGTMIHNKLRCIQFEKFIIRYEFVQKK